MSCCGCAGMHFRFCGLKRYGVGCRPSPPVQQGNSVTTVSGSNGPAAAKAQGSLLATNGQEGAAIASTNAATTNLPDAAVTNSAAALDDKYKLTVGDRLSIRILEDEDDFKPNPKPLFVTDTGDLEVPYIGRIPASNKTCKQLAAEIKAALEKKYYYQATVILAVDVMTRRHGRVYLTGAVRSPGAMELPGDEVLTLSKAILGRGGFTDYADRRHVRVTRKDIASKDDAKAFFVDVEEVLTNGKLETDLTLESGDLIYVPVRSF